MKLGQNIGIIFRNYDVSVNKDKILKMKKFCKMNKRQFYLANNLKLAINLDLNGAYIPSFNKNH